MDNRSGRVKARRGESEEYMPDSLCPRRRSLTTLFVLFSLVWGWLEELVQGVILY
jgi:hypothetical protein